MAPATGELLSGSSPPAEFFNPIVFLLLACLYGSGAIIVRELKVRWKKDFRSLLLLGAAYGILEEGLMVKSFFDPAWIDLGVLGSYGRWLDVNWVWVEMLIIYHAVFSITIPVVLVELAYPERKNDRWISARTFKALVIVLFAVTAIGLFLLTPYIPPLPQYVLAIVAMSLFGYAAYKLPPKNQEPHRMIRKTKSLWAVGLASTTAFFMLSWAGPYVISEPIAIMLLTAVLVFGMLKLLDRYSWETSESAMSRLAIVSGALSFLIILAPLGERDPTRKDNPAGMTLVALATLIGLLLLRRKIRKNSV